MKLYLIAAAAALVAVPALAEGEADLAKGEADFGKCKACHMIADGDTVIQKGGKVGPNLFAVIGRPAGSVEDFKYSKGMEEVEETGLIWDEAILVTYLADPTAWLKEASGDASAKSKMTFKLKDGTNIAAYLASVAPPPAATTN